MDPKRLCKPKENTLFTHLPTKATPPPRVFCFHETHRPPMHGGEKKRVIVGIG